MNGTPIKNGLAIPTKVHPITVTNMWRMLCKRPDTRRGISRFILFVSALLLALVGTPRVIAAAPLQVDVKQKPSNKEWKARETWTVAHAVGFQPRNEPAKVSLYGGDPTRKFGAKGFFNSKKVGERWWLVDPEGYPFLHVALCSVTPAIGSNKAKAAFEKKFGTQEKWAELTLAMMRANGFNGSGSWSDDALLRKTPQPVAYCPNWNFMSSYGKKRGGTFQKSGHRGYPNDAIFVFDPEFETFAMEHAKQLATWKDDPWLLGHFSDNELPFNANCLDGFLALPQEDHGSQAAWQWLRKRKGETIDAKKINNEDREAFLEVVAERYFTIVAKAIKTHDPNHLYLGCRFHGQAKNSAGVFRAAGKHCDVISVNLYGAWTPDAQQLENWVKWSGKPFMVTEFYAKGVDSGMPNNSGAGWLVKTQNDRGLFYQNFCLALMESKGCVGWHYFKYQDNDLENKKVDPSNTDSNKGLVSAYFEPYPDCLKPMQQLNRNVYGLIEWMDRGGKVHPR